MRATVNIFLGGILGGILIICDASDFSACAAGGGGSFVSDYGDCFWLRRASRRDYASTVATDCAPGQGHAAFPQTEQLRASMEALLVALNVDYAWVGLVQEAGAAEPSDGWQWQLADGTGWPAPEPLVPWNGGNDDTEADNSQDFVVVARDYPGYLHDTRPASHRVICQYQPPSRKFERVAFAGAGRKIEYPIAETRTSVGQRLKCARLCHGASVCLAFSYSPPAQICHLHPRSSSDPVTTPVDDTDFEIWDKVAA